VTLPAVTVSEAIQGQNIMKLAILTITASLLAFQGTAQAAPEVVRCSYYSKGYDGRVTASGEKFDSSALTAAHRRYRFGTKLKLTNIANDKSVVVTVNDRGPFVRSRGISCPRRHQGDRDDAWKAPQLIRFPTPLTRVN
jgi:rare lipoprotein A